MQPGTRLGPYEIVAAIGAGGMGEVYRARDTRLGREVAIKVLPAEFAADPDRLRRFEQEARAVAALDHPNILALYDVGTHEGSPYLVTQLLEGETLRERLLSGALPVRKVMELTAQVCSGLAAAHEKGIVHRDLKPENLFVTGDGHVKILDFGVAKLLAPAREDALAPTVVDTTQPGTVVGTVAYMSPEQVRGQPVDHRSDIFSFGVVLYEMVTGRQAFLRDTAAETMTAILKEEPPELAESGAHTPLALEGIVRHCLEKRPEERFQSARDLAFNLRAISPDAGGTRTGPAVATSARRRRLAWRAAGGVAVALLALIIAGWKLLWRAPAQLSQEAREHPVRVVVLPFENLGAPEDAYFSAGMAEEITSRLANVQGLGVTSRTSAVGYDRKGKTVKQIGSDLGVDYVLEGSVRWERAGGRESRVRITPQLIRVADDTHVWADRYDRVIADVFAIQSEVAESVVRAMGVTMLPREQSALREVSTSDLRAYDLYLRAQELDSRGISRSDVEGAEKLYQAAVDRDPKFAQALAGLARSSLMMYWEYYDRSQERVERAREAATRAVALRPDLARPHIALGLYYYQGLLDYRRALAEFNTALELQPNSGEALESIGFVLRRQGRWSEAAEKFLRVVELDPKNASRFYDLGFCYELAGRYAASDRAMLRSLDINPQADSVWAERSWLQLQWHGDAERARAILEEAGHVPGLLDDAGYLGEVRWRVVLTRRDYPAALQKLQAERRPAIDNQDGYWPVPLLQGRVLDLAGRHDLARRSFEAARAELEQKVGHDPDDHRFRSSLGIAYAGLGRKDDAVREALLACDLMPASKDALRAINRVSDLAVVYAMVGRSADAIATLDDLLGRSGWFSAHWLRLDPTWDPLRSDPRFQALLSKYEVKE